MRIAIAGRTEQSGNYGNYIRYVETVGAIPVVTLAQQEIIGCDGLLLPGGGDITPAFYGTQNHGSDHIDTELDILQLQAFDLALLHGIPVLGICKGLQLINVALHGTLIQDLGVSGNERHRRDAEDKYHEAVMEESTWLHECYGGTATVNSAHHQAIDQLGEGLEAVSRCPEDGCIEAIAHRSLPIIGVQWHPERVDREMSGTDGGKVLRWFVSRFLP